MKRIISLILVVAMMAGTSVSVFAHDFTDVAGHWAEENIDFAYEIGMINGDGDGKFRPDDTITRAEFVKMLMASFFGMMTDEPISDDLATVDHWASKYYEAGVQMELFEPTSEAEFKVKTADGEVYMGTMTPENFDYRIERWEMAYLLGAFSAMCVQYDVAMYEKAMALETYEDLVFKDKVKIATYPTEALVSIAFANIAEILMGDENGNFNPDAFGTRAEAVVMINRTMVKVAPIVLELLSSNAETETE